MGVEPDAVRSLIGGDGRRHPAHAATFADEVDRQLVAGAKVLGRRADVPVELSCEL